MVGAVRVRQSEEYLYVNNFQLILKKKALVQSAISNCSA